MPPYEIERKFLILRPDLLNLSALCRVQEIHQTYLAVAEGSVRIRKTIERGKVVYTETTKRSLSPIRRIEIERELSEEEYNRRLSSRDPRRQTIQKTRYCLPYNGHTYEIDIYSFWRKQAIMEVELQSEKEEFSLPPFIRVLREVTSEPQYSNYALAREVPPEDEL